LDFGTVWLNPNNYHNSHDIEIHEMRDQALKRMYCILKMIKDIAIPATGPEHRKDDHNLPGRGMTRFLRFTPTCRVEYGNLPRRSLTQEKMITDKGRVASLWEFPHERATTQMHILQEGTWRVIYVISYLIKKVILRGRVRGLFLSLSLFAPNESRAGV
jgi:hypothetical protein